MRRRLAFGLATATLLAAPAALPCGMPFGLQFRVDPVQDIVVAHKAGIETYQFAPHFCGQAKDFGLILPVPGTLVSNPAIGDSTLVPLHLGSIAAPIVTVVDTCRTRSDQGAGGNTGVGGAALPGGGVTVINAGTVGMFDWTLLKADSTKAFTDWLDANGYPYQSAAQTAFAAYVTDGWYFVAFKVTAAAEAPPAGRELCGDLGPIRLAFTSQKPVIPARITAAGGIPEAGVESRQNWHVFTITGRDQVLGGPGVVNSTLRFAGSLTSADLTTAPAVGVFGSAGDRLNEFNLDYLPSQLSADITFADAAADKDYRRVVLVPNYIDCPGAGGSSGAGGVGNSGGSGGLGGSNAGGSGGIGGSNAGGSGVLTGGGGSAGSGGSTAQGGSTAAGGAGGAGGSQTGSGGATLGAGGATIAPAQPAETDSGGGCSVSVGSAGAQGALALGLVGALFGTRRRRRQKP